jgi:lysophospholipid acyltransferase
MTGLGFNGYDPQTGRTLWDRVKNIDIWAIETSQSFKILFDSWNCRTNVSSTPLLVLWIWESQVPDMV